MIQKLYHQSEVLGGRQISILIRVARVGLMEQVPLEQNCETLKDG